MNTKLKSLLRWLCVIPIAILAYFIVFKINIDCLYALPFEFLRNVVMTFVFAGSGCAFVVTGSLMAPSHKEIVSVILATSLSVVMIIGLIVQFYHPEEYLLIDKIWNIAIITGTIIGSFTIYEGIDI